MSKIYVIENDFRNFQSLDLETFDLVIHKPKHIPLDDVLHFSQRNTRFSEWWYTPETKHIKNEGSINPTIPDLAHWHRGTLVLSPRAHRLLGETLAQSGELLPVIVRDETFYIYNCFVFGEEDKEKTKFSYMNDEPFELVALEFTPETAENLLFKSKSESSSLFCNEQFKQLVEANELTGIEFNETLLMEF